MPRTIGTVKPIAPAPPPPACSFCGRTQHEAEVLLEGVAANICDNCVTECAAVVKRQRAKKK